MQDNQTKWKTNPSGACPILARASFLFCFVVLVTDHFFENPYLLALPISVTSDGSPLETKGASTYSFHLFQVWGDERFSPTPITKSEGVSELLSGSNNSDCDLGRFLPSVTVAKAWGKAIYILVDLWGACQRCQLLPLNYSSLFAFSAPISPGGHRVASLFIIIWEAREAAWASESSLQSSRHLSDAGALSRPIIFVQGIGKMSCDL